MDITRRYSGTWIIDFGIGMSENEAALYEAPFEYAVKYIKPLRVGKREDRANQRWWLMQRTRPELRSAVALLSRFIATLVSLNIGCLSGLVQLCFPIVESVPSPAVMMRPLASCIRGFMNNGHWQLVHGMVWATIRLTTLIPASRPSPSPRA